MVSRDVGACMAMVDRAMPAILGADEDGDFAALVSVLAGEKARRGSWVLIWAWKGWQA